MDRIRIVLIVGVLVLPATFGSARGDVSGPRRGRDDEWRETSGGPAGSLGTAAPDDGAEARDTIDLLRKSRARASATATPSPGAGDTKTEAEPHAR